MTNTQKSFSFYCCLFFLIIVSSCSKEDVPEAAPLNSETELSTPTAKSINSFQAELYSTFKEVDIYEDFGFVIDTIPDVSIFSRRLIGKLQAGAILDTIPDLIKGKTYYVKAFAAVDVPNGTYTLSDEYSFIHVQNTGELINESTFDHDLNYSESASSIISSNGGYHAFVNWQAIYGNSISRTSLLGLNSSLSIINNTPAIDDQRRLSAIKAINNDEGNIVTISNSSRNSSIGTDETGPILTKYAPNGVKIQEKIIHLNLAENEDFRINDLIQDREGNYILTGIRIAPPNEPTDANSLWIKVNGEFNMIGNSNFGEIGIREEGKAIVATPDNGYIIAGDAHSVTDNNSKGRLVYKVNTNGEVEWSKIYEENNTQYTYGILKSQDDNYIVTGTTTLLDFKGQVYTQKINGNGDEIWSKKIDFPKSAALSAVMGGPQTLTEGIGGSLYITGRQNEVLYLLKLNGNGEYLWDEWFDNATQGNAIITTANGNLVIAGIRPDPNGPVGYGDAWFGEIREIAINN